ncbi:MAG: TlpA disulfide reductase family protein [Anaerolineales bacterium]|jgi:thiol-disulfide isomerase/thioredoxin
MLKKLPFLLLIAALFALTACGANQNVAEDMMKEDDAMTEEDDMMDDSSADDSMGDETHDDDMMDEEESDSGDMMDEEESDSDDMSDDMAMVETPAWFDYTFTDASTGQTFTINDFQGKVVLVETMAMWCSNCFKQQTQVNELHDLLGERDDFVGIGLDIDPNEDIAALKGYVEKNAFHWLYSVPPAEISREIGSLYGSQFLNPPSTPILIVDRHGEAHPLPFGIKSAQDLLGYLEPFLNEGM